MTLPSQEHNQRWQDCDSFPETKTQQFWFSLPFSFSLSGQPHAKATRNTSLVKQLRCREQSASMGLQLVRLGQMVNDLSLN